MEKLSKERLPPIFKMSVLWNILPYYDYLHRWKILLTKLNKATMKIWTENMKALIYLGRDFKKEKYLKSDESLNDINFEWIDLISLSSWSLDTFDNKNVEKLFAFCKKLNKDKVIVCELHKSSFDDIKIYIIKRENIFNTLPAILCPSFKIKKISL